MSQSIIIEISDEAYAVIALKATQDGVAPAQVAEMLIEQIRGKEPANQPPDEVDQEAREIILRLGGTLPNDLSISSKSVDGIGAQVARERFERHFGIVDLGRATGIDNASIDADLAREYGSAER